MFWGAVCCELPNIEEANSWYGESYYGEEDIPQEIGAEWTRELYFKENPSQKIILSAKNVPTEILYIGEEDYTLYYVVGVVVIIALVVTFFVLRRKR